MAIQVEYDQSGTPTFPSRVHERKLESVLAELRRHERIKDENGGQDIHDRALHFRVKRITKDP